MPPESTKNQRFSDVFKEYKNRSMASNGLKIETAEVVSNFAFD